MSRARAAHVEGNRRAWDVMSERFREPGRRAWASDEPSWGIWSVPERELGALPDVAGRDTVELGCGTAYWSAWLARRGARPTGVDISPRQLANARAFQREFGLEFPLVEADAEDVPLPDGCCDVVLSEYGASIWCDPYRWLPEAVRLLRPGGTLVFLKNGTLLSLCMPDQGAATERLLRPSFGLHSLHWEDDGSTEFQLSHGEWIRLFRRLGLVVEDLLELRPPKDAVETPYEYVDLAWARRWPSEEIWRLGKP